MQRRERCAPSDLPGRLTHAQWRPSGAQSNYRRPSELRGGSYPRSGADGIFEPWTRHHQRKRSLGARTRPAGRLLLVTPCIRTCHRGSMLCSGCVHAVRSVPGGKERCAKRPLGRSEPAAGGALASAGHLTRAAPGHSKLRALKSAVEAGLPERCATALAAWRVAAPG